MSQPKGSSDDQPLLTSLAILKTNWDLQKKSYLDNFVPFVADCMRSSTQAEFTPGDLTTQIETRFGIRIPVAVMESILRRAARSGLGSRRYGRFVLDRSKLNGFDISRQRQEALREHEALTTKLQTFASSQYGRELSSEEAEASLLAHIEGHSAPLLQAAVAGTLYRPDRRAGEDLDYIVSSFIVNIFERDPEGFAYLETLVKGSMLASVLYLPNVGEIQRRFDRNAHVYFDTPVLLSALGYEGPEGEAATREALELAYELGAQLACFEHTVAEIRGVLTSLAEAIGRPRRHPGQTRSVEAYFVRAGYTPSDIEVLIDRLEADLEALRIRVIPRPPHVTELTVDETELEQLLQSDVRYPMKQTLLYDLESLTAIHRLRSGQSPVRLESCHSILVTTNAPLVSVSRKFFTDDRPEIWPPAIGYHDFVTLLWLKKPLAAPDLPRKQIVADCYAALEPGPTLWNRYLDEVERLQARGDVTENEFFFLRYSFDAKRALMERTLGKPERVSTQVVEKVIEEAKTAIQAPVLDRLKAAQQSVDTVKAAEARAAAADKAEAQRRALADSARRDARNRAQPQARWFGRILLVAVAGVLVVAAWLSLPSSVELAPERLPTGFRWASRLVLLLAGAIGVLSAVSRWTPKALTRSFEVWIARNLEKRYESKALARLAQELFGPAEGPDEGDERSLTREGGEAASDD